MSKVSADEVRRLARLSRIKLTDEEVERFRNEIESILGYVSKLQAADTDGLDATSQVTGLVNVTREDKAKGTGVTKEQLTGLAPEQQEGYIKVKRVL